MSAKTHDAACDKDVRGKARDETCDKALGRRTMQLAVKMSVKTCDAACDKDVGEDNGKLIMERKIKAGLWSSALVLRVWKLFARILCVAVLAILVLPVSS